MFREAGGGTKRKFGERREHRSRKLNKIDRMLVMSCILTNALFEQDVGKCLEFGVCSGILRGGRSEGV